MKTVRNNKGYSLVELLLTIVIFGVVMIGVAMIMRTSSVSYVNGTQEVAVQSEVQILANQVEEMLVDATGNLYADRFEEDGVAEDYYWKIDAGNECHCFRLDISENELLYQSRELNTGVNANLSSWTLMAEYVTDFDITGWEKRADDVVPSANCDNKVTIKIEMDNDGYVYELSRDVFFRNAIEDNTVYQIPDAGAGSGGSGVAIKEYVLDRYAVLDLKKEFDIVSITSVTKGVTDNYDYVTVEYQPKTDVAGDRNMNPAYAIKKVSTSAAPTTCLMLKSNFYDFSTDGYGKTVTATNNAIIVGTTSTNKTVTVRLLTNGVDYTMENNLLVLTTETGEQSYSFVGVEGIDIKAMMAIQDTLDTDGRPFQYSLVTYTDSSVAPAKPHYVFSESNKPSAATTSNVIKHESNDCLIDRITSAGGVKATLGLRADPETNGFIIVNKLSNQFECTDAAKLAMEDGNYRIAIMIHYPGQDITSAHDVVDIPVVYQGCNLEYYEPVNTYTEYPSTWGVTFTADNLDTKYVD